MTKRKQKKALNNNPDIQMGGINIYMDDRGRYVYYNRFDHNGYILTGYEKQYRPYSSRFILGLIAGLFATLFELPVIVCVIIGIAAYLLMEFRFRRFLKTIPVIPHFQPKKKTGPIQREAAQESKKIILKMILLLLLSILLIVNAQMQKMEGYMLYLTWIVAAIVLVMAFVEIRALMLKQQKK